MDRFFWVKWKDSKKCEYVVGLLAYVNENYYFKYNPEFKNEQNIPAGFRGIIEFGRIVEVNEEQKAKNFAMKSSKQLFNFFKIRIPKQSEEYKWKNEEMEEYDECELLSRTQGKISTDYFFVEEMERDAIKEVQDAYIKLEEMSVDR